MSDFFCIAPWKHLYLHTTGEVKTCCVGATQHGDLKQSTLQEVFGSENYKNLRRDFNSGEKTKLISENCARCIEMEENNIHSLRESLNDLFKEDIEEVRKNTSNDGDYFEFKIEYLDARFSNLCNFKCRSCTRNYSSSIYAENIQDYNLTGHSPYVYAGKTREDLFDQILQQVDNFKKIYFAGGEPLIQWEHWSLLDAIIEREITDVSIVYNTNLSNLTFKDKNVTDYWNRLNDVLVLASLDGMGSPIEYWRKGSNWDQICKNIESIKSESPHVKIGTTTTIGWTNIYNALDFIDHCIDTSFIDYKLININVLQVPEIYSVTTVPAFKKALIEERITQTLNKIRSLRNNEISLLERNLEALITFMYSKNTEEYIQSFFQITERMDKFRSENFFDAFPEHTDLKEYYGK